MATLDPVLVGITPDDGNGDPLRDAFIKINSNETNLNAQLNLAQVNPTKRVVVNAKSDFPTPAGGIITLAADTEYLMGNPVSIGTDQIVMSSSSVLCGLSNYLTFLTYTGTGDAITVTNVGASVNNIVIIASSGRGINWSDNTDSALVLQDVFFSCDKTGLFNSTGTNGSSLLSRNISSVTTTDGVTFSGDWAGVVWQSIRVNVGAGNAFNLTGATFREFTLDLISSDLPSGSSFVVGDAASANILLGGRGSISRITITGLGTALSGLTVDDVRWEFSHNSSVLPDSKPDAFIFTNNNALETAIGVAGTPVKVNAVWTEQRISHFTSDSTGKITYVGESNIVVPIIITATVKAKSGTNKDMGILLSLNGVVIADSISPNKVGGTDPKNTTTLWQLELEPNDYLEVYVQNDTDTINLIATGAKILVN